MKSAVYLACASIAIMTFQSCMPVYRQVSSNATESFIKNVVEIHSENDFSSIRTCQIFNGPATNGGMLELTGYKYLNAKNLVISASESYTTPAGRGQGQQGQQVHSETVFIQLTGSQVKKIVDNYQLLESRIKAEQPVPNEVVYHDFTASSDLFVSYSRAAGSYGNQSANYMHLWIKGNKFTISSAEMIRRLEAFLKY